MLIPFAVRRRATTAALLAAVATSSLVSGCSGAQSSPSTDPVAGVASIASSPQPSKAEPNPQDARPVLRPDSSDDDWQRMYRAYYDCLVQHGVPRPSGNNTVGKVSLDENDPRHKAALRACQFKEPERYEDREKRQNFAAYSDHNRQAITCMKEHDVQIEVDSSGEWGLKYGAEGGKWMRSCMRQAFVGSK